MNKLIEKLDEMAKAERKQDDGDSRWYKDYERLYHNVFWAYTNMEDAKVITEDQNPAARDVDELELEDSIRTVQKCLLMGAAECIKGAARCDEWLVDIQTSRDLRKMAESIRKQEVEA